MYGLDRELAEKAAANYDHEREAQAKAWLEEVTGETWEDGTEAFEAALKDGTILCKAINAIKQRPCIKISTSKLAFKQMENIAMFLREAETLGCPQYELFQTVDLFEAKNMTQVINSLFSLSRNATSLGHTHLPILGPKLATATPRSFSEETLRKGRSQPSQQMGFTGGATQRSMGVTMGGTRDVTRGEGASKDMGRAQSEGFLGGATQKSMGVNFGGNRDINKSTGASKDIPSQQTSGHLKGANASGVSFGGRRDILTYSDNKPMSGKEAADAAAATGTSR